MSNKEEVARLLDKRNSEPEEVEETFSLEGEHDLSETEQLKLENILLKIEMIGMERDKLIGQRNKLAASISHRLGATDSYEMLFSKTDARKVELRRRQKNVGNKK